MAERTTRQNRGTDTVTALFASLTVLVGGLYLMIWLNPYVPVNPFPPGPKRGTLFAHMPSVRIASNNPLQPTAPFPPTWTPTATGTPTPTRLPTSTPYPTNTPTATATPNPFWNYYITGMRGRRYQGSQVSIHGLFGGSSEYTAYLIFYISDGLRISGMMNVPKGPGPFPVIILCHGYFHPEKYATGNGTWRAADYLANQGYITIAPDYRGHAGSDKGTSFYHIGYAQDVLNLIASLRTVEKADPRRIGLWGHSMGGAVALKAAVVSKNVDAIVVFASVHADERVNFTYAMGDGPAAWFGTPNTNRLGYKRVSPINYLHLSPPLSIHHGTGDTIVPYEWSKDLFEAAQEQGATAELHLYPDAEHTFLDEYWDQAIERAAAFFDKYVKKSKL